MIPAQWIGKKSSVQLKCVTKCTPNFSPSCLRLRRNMYQLPNNVKDQPYQNKVRQQTRQAASMKEQNLAEPVKTNPRMFWNHINSKRIARPDIPSLKNPTTGLLIERSAEKADLLNTYFTTVFTQEPIQSSLPTLQTIVPDQTPRIKIEHRWS